MSKYKRNPLISNDSIFFNLPENIQDQIMNSPLSGSITIQASSGISFMNTGDPHCSTTQMQPYIIVNETFKK